jgi:hypothetical protein
MKFIKDSSIAIQRFSAKSFTSYVINFQKGGLPRSHNIN